MIGILPFLKEKHLNVLFLMGASLILIGMPFSLALMSIGSIWISCVYLLEGGYREKIRALNNPILWGVFIFLGVNILGMAWTENSSQGWKELLKVLPLFSIPVVFSGISTVTKKQQKYLIYLFVLAVVVSIISIYGIAFFRGTLSQSDPREVSIFTSHIRLALFSCFSLVIVLFSRFSLGLKSISVCVLLLFIWKIQSLTGVVILSTLLVSILLGLIRVPGLKSLKWLSYVSVILFILSFWFMGYTFLDYYTIDGKENTPALTSRGKKYNPELENGFVENGGYLWSYVSYSELEEVFQQKTGKSIWDKGTNGFAYYGTIIRYLNNSGYTKDYDGISLLVKEDFDRILAGDPYPNYWKYKGFSKRLRGLLFHIEKNKFNPDFNGNSLVEKSVFQTAGWYSYLNSPVLGAGTGDLKSALAEYYIENYPHLEKNKRRKPHNQYLTILIKFGPVGLISFLMVFLLLWKYAPQDYESVSRAFLIILLMSFLGEDTIENQAGITFFSTFIGLIFLLNTRK